MTTPTPTPTPTPTQTNDAITRATYWNYTSILHFAVLEGDMEICKLALEKGCWPGHSMRGWNEEDELSPLGIAYFIKKDMKLVHLLLEYMDEDAVTSEFETTLLNANCDGIRDINYTTLLLEHGADPDGHCRIILPPPLHEAAYRDDLEMCKLLIRYGADPLLRDPDINEDHDTADGFTSDPTVKAYLIECQAKARARQEKKRKARVDAGTEKKCVKLEKV